MIDDTTRLVIMGCMMIGLLLLVIYGDRFYDDED